MPSSEQLSDDILEEVARLMEDFPTFAADNLKIRPKDGDLSDLKFNKAQLYIHSEAEKQRKKTGRVRKVIVKGRQQGCSTYVEGRAYHYTAIRKGRRAMHYGA